MTTLARRLDEARPQLRSVRTAIGLFILLVVPSCGGGSDDTPAPAAPAPAAGCPAGFTECGEECTSLRFDPSNCGECGTACPQGETCVGGECMFACAGGSIQCGDVCTNPAIDPANCGECGKACASGELCVEGACATYCPPGFEECPGTCARVASDPENCGACGKVCKAGELCSKGTCLLTCPPGLSACQGECVNPQSDQRHCGGCEQACIKGQVCLAGSCEASCPAGFDDCAGLCIDTKNNVEHCGACDQACATGEACVNGACKVWCPVGQSLCAEGCIDLKVDPSHCGACDTACAATQTCLNGTCVSQPNGYGLVDAWGYLWDGIQRPARTWEAARDDCASVGGRLPTATEVYRNHAGQTNVAPLGEPHLTSWLWTAIATSHSDLRRVVGRWSDGTAGNSVESQPRNYRCVWPDHTADAFEGDACYGVPGAECAAAGLFWNVDPFDRPALEYGAAANECAFYHASLPTMRDAQELIQTGWANPSSAWSWVSDARTWYDNNFGLAIVKWSADPQPAWGYDAGTDGAVSVATTARAFRCIGKKSASQGVPAPAPACMGGSCFTTTNRRATLVADTADRTPAGFAVAADNCRTLGGALPDSGEFVELVHAGWAGGTNAWLWSNEPLTWFDGNYGHAVFRWDGAGNERWTVDATTMGVSSAASARPYRCVWHETLGGATATSCTFAQNQSWDGAKFVCKAAVAGNSNGQANPAGQQIVDAWGNAWDFEERAALAFEAARDACVAAGARLPMPTEVYRARADQTLGQPIGDASATSWLWTMLEDGAAGRRIAARVSDGATSSQLGSDALPFRCVWPVSKGDVLDGRACHGVAPDACFVSGRIRSDTYDRAALPASAASNECAFFGGRLPDVRELAALVDGEAPNGSNAWLWMAEPAQWYSGNYGYSLGRWSGTGTPDWAFESPAFGAVAVETEYRTFRCVFTDALR